jgi:hypothetical protein
MQAADVAGTTAMAGPNITAVLLRMNGDIIEVELDMTPAALSINKMIGASYLTFAGAIIEHDVVIVGDRDVPVSEENLNRTGFPSRITNCIYGDVIALRMPENIVPTSLYVKEFMQM